MVKMREREEEKSESLERRRRTMYPKLQVEVGSIRPNKMDVGQTKRIYGAGSLLALLSPGATPIGP